MRSHSVFAQLSIVLYFASVSIAMAQHMNAANAPCQAAGSGAETTQCFDEAAKSTDLELNHFYRTLQTKLAGEDQEKLRTAQRQWLQFRDANCAAERQLYTGGSAASMVYQACLEADTRARTQELHTMYDWRLNK
jgi:uncharacterized protein YecT (DUF1311 family)